MNTVKLHHFFAAVFAIALYGAMCGLSGMYIMKALQGDSAWEEGAKWANESCYNLVNYAWEFSAGNQAK